MIFKMKKILLLSAFVAASFITNAQKAGKILVQEDKGKSFQLGSEKSVQTGEQQTNDHTAYQGGRFEQGNRDGSIDGRPCFQKWLETKLEFIGDVFH